MQKVQIEILFRGLENKPTTGPVLFTLGNNPNVIKHGFFDGMYFYDGIDLSNANLNTLTKKKREIFLAHFKRYYLANIDKWAPFPNFTEGNQNNKQ